MIAVIAYFAEGKDRIERKHYRAWQVINTAQGKGGSGGRIDALEQLNNDHTPWYGVDVSGAFLQGVDLNVFFGVARSTVIVKIAALRSCLEKRSN